MFFIDLAILFLCFICFDWPLKIMHIHVSEQDEFFFGRNFLSLLSIYFVRMESMKFVGQATCIFEHENNHALCMVTQRHVHYVL